MKTNLDSVSNVGLAIAALIAGVFAFSAAPVLARNIDCDSSNPNLGDLQDAIDESEVGAELRLSGTCEGPFVITKAISLFGPATLSAPNGGFAVLSIINGGHATLRDLTIDASGADAIGINVEASTVNMGNVVVEGPVNEGIRLIGTSNGHFRGGAVRGANTGLVVTISSSVFLFGYTAENNVYAGITVTENSAGGIFSGVSTITGNNVGIFVDGSSTLQMDGGNTISENTDAGVVAGTYGFVTFFGANTFERNGTDVVCALRAGFRTFVFQISDAESTNIPPAEHCLIIGDIFDPAP